MNVHRRGAGIAAAVFSVVGCVVFTHPMQSISQELVPVPSRTQVQKAPPVGTTTPGQKVQPKLEAIAETRLLMDGLARANYRGLERLLLQAPTDNQGWIFARGQALLLAETGNLLMLRPPRTEGQPQWFLRATEFRTQARQLAQYLAAKDYHNSKAALVQLANSCNRCHQTFRVPVEISPFETPAPPAQQNVAPY